MKSMLKIEGMDRDEDGKQGKDVEGVEARALVKARAQVSEVDAVLVVITTMVI